MVDVPPPPRAATWHKSSASGGGECVEISRSPSYVWVRDSKDPGGGILGFTRKEWAAFLIGVERGEFANLPENT